MTLGENITILFLVDELVNLWFKFFIMTLGENIIILFLVDELVNLWFKFFIMTLPVAGLLGKKEDEQIYVEILLEQVHKFRDQLIRPKIDPLLNKGQKVCFFLILIFLSSCEIVSNVLFSKYLLLYCTFLSLQFSISAGEFWIFLKSTYFASKP